MFVRARAYMAFSAAANFAVKQQRSDTLSSEVVDRTAISRKPRVSKRVSSIRA